MKTKLYMKLLSVLNAALLTWGTATFQPALARTADDVIIGVSKPISYQRVFPLLDGIFQDVSAMQLKQLSLDPNVANSSNLNAILQQLQVGIQYSQTAGTQNSTAAQQAATNSAAAVFQTQLISQQTQLITLELAAQQQVGKAQSALDSLPSDATKDQKELAQQALTVANDNLNSIVAQLGNVKSLLATSAATPTFVSASASPPPSIQTAPLNFKTPGGDTFTPSFPASKQMDNQVNLLWERLARLVNTLVQPDKSHDIFLVPFHTGITPGKLRVKHELLSTQYSLKCDSPAATESPTVLDLFPRSAAVNITDEKYKDSRFGLSALVSFFSVGINSAYNREHLKITQALGQSAYITGFGIETSSFGWVFGPALGEDYISPGDRPTFALVSVPTNCGTATVQRQSVVWDKNPTVVPPGGPGTDIRAWDIEEKPSPCDGCVSRINYSPVEFDHTKPAPATIDILLTDTLDPEATVSVDGLFLKRARDTFGRATTSGGSGGLLESSTIDVNTWIPINPHELILTIEASYFANRFPKIVMTSPHGFFDVTGSINCANTDIFVAGRQYTCPGDVTSLPDILPAIGRPKSTPKHFVIARWLAQDSESDQLVITPAEFATTAVGSGGIGVPTLQVISDSRNQLWSARANIVAKQGLSSAPLECSPRGERLICKVGFVDDRSADLTQLEIFDSDYSTGPVSGSAQLPGCTGTDCIEPVVWQMDPPTWDATKVGWNFRLFLINVKDGDVAILSDGAADVFTSTPVSGCTSVAPCQAKFFLPKKQFAQVRDSMSLRIRDTSGYVGDKPSEIGNLLAVISPLLTSISEDQTSFSGQNLVADSVQVGSGSKIPLQCADDHACFINGFGPKDDGFLFFTVESKRVPAMILGDKGISVVPPHHPKKKTDESNPDASKQTSPQPTKRSLPRLTVIQ